MAITLSGAGATVFSTRARAGAHISHQGRPGSSKLWSPGRWNVSQLKEVNLNQLKPMRWAFNAKPDILLLSPTGGTVIEAKLESGEGRDDLAGYAQMSIQRLVVRLATDR